MAGTENRVRTGLERGAPERRLGSHGRMSLDEREVAAGSASQREVLTVAAGFSPRVRGHSSQLIIPGRVSMCRRCGLRQAALRSRRTVG